MNFERVIGSNLRLGEKEREVWRLGNDRFDSFKVGEKVLKRRVEVGRLNVINLEINMRDRT